MATWEFLWLLFLQITTYHQSSGLVCSLVFRASTRISSSELCSVRSSSKWEKAGGILYQTSLFSKDDFQTIKKDYENFKSRLQPEIVTSIARQRQGFPLPPSAASRSILEARIVEWVRHVTGSNSWMMAPDLDVEFRAYLPGGSMPWHADDLCYDPPQLEAIITIINDSDCETCWKNDIGDVRCEWTAPNSILLVGTTPEHCVTQVKRGQRVILKCALALSHAKYIARNQKQFGSKQQRKRKRR